MGTENLNRMKGNAVCTGRRVRLAVVLALTVLGASFLTTDRTAFAAAPAANDFSWPATGNVSETSWKKNGVTTIYPDSVAMHVAGEGQRAVDITASGRVPIYAAADGVVEIASIGGNSVCYAANSTSNGYGNYVVIRHSSSSGTLYTLYAHLNSISVRKGDTVGKARTQIGTMGGGLGDDNPGCSTGRHLHWAIGTCPTVSGLQCTLWNGIQTVPGLPTTVGHGTGGKYPQLVTASPYAGKIVKTVDDQVTAWYVTPDGSRRQWIPDALVYGCLRRPGGAEVVTTLTRAELNAIPNMNERASCDNPFGFVDESTMAVGPGLVNVVGWAMDANVGTGPIAVHVYANNKLVGPLTANTYRPDVGAAYPGYGNNHGFNGTVAVPTGGLNKICVYAINNDGVGLNPLLGCRDVMVDNPNPFGSYDDLKVLIGRTLSVVGWAIDPNVRTSPISVNIYDNGKLLGSLTADKYRSDVGDAFPGVGNYHGFSSGVFSGVLTVSTAGDHVVCVQAPNVGPGSGYTDLGCRPVKVS